MNENISGPQRKRRRPTMACQRCRRRKIKCDRNTPCDQCILSKSDNCHYVPDRRFGMDGMPNPPTTSSTMSRESPSTTNIPVASALIASTDELSIPGSSSADSNKGHAPAVRTLPNQPRQLRHELPAPANKESAQSAAVSVPLHHATLPTKESFSKTGPFGQSHWMDGIEQV